MALQVVYLTPGCFDKGGISRYSRYQISALRELCGDENVSVFSLLGPDGHGFETSFATTYAAGGVRLEQKAAFLGHLFARGLTQKPRLVLSAHVNLSGAARVLAAATGATSVVNIYGLEVWSGMRPDASLGLRTSHHVISDCYFTARYVEHEGYRTHGSTSVIWDCVDLERFSPAPAAPAVVAKYGIPDPTTGLNVLTLGRLAHGAEHKGYHRLLEAFGQIAAKAPTARLVFAGAGSLIDELRAEADTRGLGARVHFTGEVHERDLADVYRCGHVFSLVSDRGKGRGEGVPLTPLEAAACGVPILVGNQDGSQEAVVDGTNGRVLDPFDAEAHARALLDLLTDAAVRQRMGAAARRRVVDEFSYETFRDQHAKLLARLGLVPEQGD